MYGIGTPLGARARAVNMRRYVQLAELFIERVPVVVAERRCFGAAVLVGVRIQETTDKTELLHAAFELGNRILNRIARRLRQGANADPLAGKKLHLAVDDIVAFLGEPVDELGWLFRLHQLKRSRGNELDVRAVVAQVIQMAFRPVLLAIGCRADLVIRYVDSPTPVSAAGRK